MKFENLKTWHHSAHLPSFHDTQLWFKQERHDAKFWILLLTLALVIFVITLAYVTRPIG